MTHGSVISADLVSISASCRTLAAKSLLEPQVNGTRRFLIWTLTPIDKSETLVGVVESQTLDLNGVIFPDREFHSKISGPCLVFGYSKHCRSPRLRRSETRCRSLLATVANSTNSVPAEFIHNSAFRHRIAWQQRIERGTEKRSVEKGREGTLRIN